VPAALAVALPAPAPGKRHGGGACGWVTAADCRQGRRVPRASGRRGLRSRRRPLIRARSQAAGLVPVRLPHMSSSGWPIIMLICPMSSASSTELRVY
jgi:hypothetical protein